MKKEVNAIGDICPIPLVKAKEAIKELNGAGVVEVLVDNEIAVQNLTKMAQQKGYGCESKKIKDQEYRVTLTVGERQMNKQHKNLIVKLQRIQKNVFHVHQQRRLVLLLFLLKPWEVQMSSWAQRY